MKSLSLLPVLPLVAKQFRNLPNFSNDLNTFLMPGWMLPGFAFMRAKGFAEVNAIYINNLAGDTIAEVDSAQMKACTTSSADYFKFSSKPTLNNALDGNSYLDNFTYLKHKQFTLPCGYYYYQIHFTDNSDVYSDIWQVVNADAVLAATDLIANGDFKTGMLQWSTTGAWTADPANNNASYSGAGSGMVLQQAISGHSSGSKRYKISFTVTSMVGTGAGNGLTVQVWDDAGDAALDQELRITGNGSYTFYASKLNIFTITSTGISDFKIGPISIKEVIGVSGEYVTLKTYNNCRGLNSLDSNDVDYLEWFMLDARIVEPEYNQTIQQSENGIAEQITTFARAIKTLNLTPLLLPEFAVTYLNTLNVYDAVGIYDGVTDDRYAYDINFDDENPEAIEITEFKLKKTDWTASGIYAETTLAFNCTIDMSDGCCGDIAPVACMDPGDYSLNITVENQGQPIVTIIEAMFTTIPGSSNLWVELFVAKVENGAFTSCGAPEVEYVSAGVIPAQQYAVIGFQYQMPDDWEGYTFCFYIKLFQVGCPEFAVSDKESYIPE